MSSPDAPVRVSFLVPTLNRGRYVARAVESCLEAGRRADVPVQVVVLDSSSDDGSWEDLVARFQCDNRVLLLQNERGSGPMPSWVETAELADGTHATFVWSDDYLFPWFLASLLPAIDGGSLAYGEGVVRHVDQDDAPAMDPADIALVASSEAIQAALRVLTSTAVGSPVSPTCGLFEIGALTAWLGCVEKLCTTSNLRREIMWRRAIGPDLLVFLVAMGRECGPVPVIRGPVAQFSEHTGSITVGSSAWLMRSGYWLAAVAAVVDLGVARGLPAADRRFTYAQLVARGLALWVSAPAELGGGCLARAEIRADIRVEATVLVRQASADVGVASFVVTTLRVVLAESLLRLRARVRLPGTRRGGSGEWAA